MEADATFQPTSGFRQIPRLVQKPRGAKNYTAAKCGPESRLPPASLISKVKRANAVIKVQCFGFKDYTMPMAWSQPEV